MRNNDLVGFSCDSVGRKSACNTGDLGLTPGLGRSHREGKGCPPQYFGLEISMDYIVFGATKSWTWLNNFLFHFSLPFRSRHLSLSLSLYVLVAQPYQTLWSPCTVAYQALKSTMARILKWVATPSSGDLPKPGIEPRSPTLQADFLLSEPSGKPSLSLVILNSAFQIQTAPLILFPLHKSYIFNTKYL